MNPDWAAIRKFGFATVVAVVLLYFVLNVVYAEIHKQTDILVDSNSLLKTHLEDSSNKLNEIRFNERALVAISTRLCVMQAKTNYERSQCVEAAERK